MHSRSTRTYLLVACLAAPSLLGGQTADPHLVALLTAYSGRTARIELDAEHVRMTGALGRVSGDTLHLVAASGISQALAVPRIVRLEIRDVLSDDARESRTQTASIVGLVVGVAIGYAIAVPSVRHAQGRGYMMPEVGYFLDPAGGALVGAAVAGLTAKAWPAGVWVNRYP